MGTGPLWIFIALFVATSVFTVALSILAAYTWLESVAISAAGVGLGGLTGTLARKRFGRRTLYPLLPDRYDFGKRRDTLRATLKLLETRGARTLVETGVARRGLDGTRGDGASTVVFGLWAQQHGAHLDSVDIDPDAISTASLALEAMGLTAVTRLHLSDSVEFLKGFPEPVDFLYLDSFDYDESDPAVQSASQRHHLEEFLAILPRLHDDTVVLIDDCDLPGGGKGRAVIDYMHGRGWKTHSAGYQTLLVRDI